MFWRTGSMYVPLNAKFVVTMLLINFVLVATSFFGIAGILPGTPGFWCCIFASTIAISFFMCGIMSVMKSIRFFSKLKQCEAIQATITGSKKEKPRKAHVQTVYYPQMSYSLGGKQHKRIGNFGYSHPKWSVGEVITLYADTETGAVAERRDGFRGLGLGLFAIILGVSVTTLFWTLYFRGMFIG